MGYKQGCDTWEWVHRGGQLETARTSEIKTIVAKDPGRSRVTEGQNIGPSLKPKSSKPTIFKQLSFS